MGGDRTFDGQNESMKHAPFGILLILLILSNITNSGLGQFFLANNSVPEFAQRSHVVLAFFLEQKSFDAFVVPTEVPFIRIAMLEQAPALEIVLTHRAFNGRNWV